MSPRRSKRILPVLPIPGQVWKLRGKPLNPYTVTVLPKKARKNHTWVAVEYPKHPHQNAESELFIPDFLQDFELLTPKET